MAIPGKQHVIDCPYKDDPIFCITCDNIICCQDPCKHGEY